MAQTYPFIDIAVLDGVRQRLCAGDALCLLTPELDEVLWANAAGARMIGFAVREEAIGAEPGIGAAARRQILAGQPGKKIAVRLAGAVTSRLAIVETACVSLPAGGSALLLAESKGAERPESIIEGLDDEACHAAIFGPGGEVVAASPGLHALGIDALEFASLAREVSSEVDRMVKRRIHTKRGYLPAGVGRLGDDPETCLLLVVEVDLPASAVPGPSAEAEVDHKVELLVTNQPALNDTGRWYFADEGRFAKNVSAELEIADSVLQLAADEALEEASANTSISRENQEDVEPQTGVRDEPAPMLDAITPGLDNKAVPPPEETGVGEPEPGTVLAAVERDEIDLTPVTPVYPDISNTDEPYIEHDEMPVRFVWRIDANGRFSSVSPELAQAIGPRAADILGRTFKEVALAFAMDASGEISELLDRRDTWSGRSVTWPMEGTDMRVPVDLAALPIYGRDRTFEGFKGFGIVRLADAVPDPEAIGLSFETQQFAEGGSTGAEAPQPGEERPLEDDPWHGEIPALSGIQNHPANLQGSDGKIILLEERRVARADPAGPPASPVSSLTASERIAFREIAERLRSDNANVPEAPSGNVNDVSGTHDQSDSAVSAGTDEAPFEAATDALNMADADLDKPVIVQPLALEGSKDEALARGDETSGPIAKYEQMLRDLLETAEKPVLASDAEIESPVPPAAKYAGMFRDILDTIESPPIDQRMIPVRTTNEILREAEEHHQQDLEEQRSLPQAETAATPVDAPELNKDLDTEPGEAGTKSLQPPEDADGKSNIVGEMPEDNPLIAPSAPKPHLRPAPDTSILMRLPAPVLIYAGKSVHFANPAFLEATGYGSARELEILGGIDQLIAGDSSTDTSDRINIRIRGNGVRAVNAVIRSVPWDEAPAMMLTIRDGDEAHHVRASPLSNDALRSLEELQQEAAELSSILDTATDGVVILDSAGNIRSLNHSAEALFGFNPAEIVGKPFSLLLATESQRAVDDYISGLTGKGVASIMNDGREVIGREAHGRFIPLFVTIGRLPGSEGFCAVLRDMTQWKRAEEGLIEARRSAEQASATKTEFLTRVSHEIRTPLNAIIGFSELMAEERFGPMGSPRYLDYAKDINRSGRHVLDLVNDLLDISKIEAGEQEMNFEAVALNDALSEAVALMQPQANRERVIIRSSFASTLPDVVADLRSVKQIALNLLSNAVRYTGAGGQVIISTAYELTGDVVIRVRDTGVGMSQQDLEQAMKPFKQLNTVKRGRGDGTGLGLPLTKALVEGNRAKFVITSTPGKGTMVEITFPSVRVLAN